MPARGDQAVPDDDVKVNIIEVSFRNVQLSQAVTLTLSSGWIQAFTLSATTRSPYTYQYHASARRILIDGLSVVCQ